MKVSTYLYKKYSHYSKDEKQKPFNVSHIQEELQVNNAVAQLYVRDVMEKNLQCFNYWTFEKIVCSVLDLE